MASSGVLVTNEMHIGFDREARRRKNALGLIPRKPLSSPRPSVSLSQRSMPPSVLPSPSWSSMRCRHSRRGGTIAKPGDDHRVLDRIVLW